MPFRWLCVVMEFATFKLLSTALGKTIPSGVLHYMSLREC